MKQFTFYEIYYTPLKELDDEQASRFFRNICDYLDGKQTETDGKASPEFELYWESIADDLEIYRKSSGKSCGLDKRYKHFPFLSFYRKAFGYLSEDEGGAFIKMLCAYIFDNKTPAKTESNAFKYFNICKRKLDESKQRMQNGAKGGRPKKAKVLPKAETVEQSRIVQVNVSAQKPKQSETAVGQIAMDFENKN